MKTCKSTYFLQIAKIPVPVRRRAMKITDGIATVVILIPRGESHRHNTDITPLTNTHTIQLQNGVWWCVALTPDSGGRGKRVYVSSRLAKGTGYRDTHSEMLSQKNK